MEEIEVKFLDVDVDAFKKKIISLGAIFVGEYFYKRKIYDYTDLRLEKENAWVRLRTDGKDSTITYKQRFGIENDSLRDGGMKEIEVQVNDFELTDLLLQSLGLKERIYKENKRKRYILDEVEIDIDSWPLIPPYVELEGKSWESIETLAGKIGLDWTKHLRCSNREIYGIYNIDENSYSVLTFTSKIKK